MNRYKEKWKQIIALALCLAMTFTSLPLQTMTVQAAETNYAQKVTIQMNATSQTFTLQDEEGNNVDLSAMETESQYQYHLRLDAGEYTLTGYASDGTTVNGTIGLTVTGEENQVFSIYTASGIYATNSDWNYGTDYTVLTKVFDTDGGERNVTTGWMSSAYEGKRASCLAMSGDTIRVTLTPDSILHSEYLALSKQSTVTANVSYGLNGAIPLARTCTVTLPSSAYDLRVGTLTSSYIYSDIESQDEPVENMDGTITYTYKMANGASYYTRVQSHDTNQVTYWNWITPKEDSAYTVSLTDLYGDDDTITSKTIVDDFSKNPYDTGDLYLTVNKEGFIHIPDINGTYQLEAFRNWQAIEGIGNAKIAEPEYHYTVIDANGNASDVISITSKENNSGIATITANKKGTAIVLVTYDAMTNAAGWKGDFFSASWPENTGVFVVTVGEEEPRIDTGITLNEGRNEESQKQSSDALDAELDVLYYESSKEGATYSFRPEEDTKVAVLRPTLTENALTYTGWSEEGISCAEDGTYTISNLKEGKNILRITKEDACVYQVLKVKAVDVTLTYKDSSNEVIEKEELSAGDQIVIEYDRLYTPANKLAGIYNMRTTACVYDTDGNEYQGTGNQYQFASTKAAQTVVVTIPEYYDKSKFTLTGTLLETGFGSPYGDHRNTTYEKGKNPQFAAASRTAYLGSLPELTFDLKASPITKTSLEITDKNTGVKLSGDKYTVEITDASDHTILQSADGSYSTYAGEYTIVVYSEGYQQYQGTFTIEENRASQSISIQLVPSGSNSDTIQVTVAAYDYTAVEEGIEGASTDGTVMKETIEVEQGLGASEVVEAAMDQAGMDYNLQNGYVSSINGLSTDAEYALSGWCLDYNHDDFSNWGLNSISPKDGDEIAFHYSVDGGSDINMDYYGQPILSTFKLDGTTISLSKETLYDTATYTSNTKYYYDLGSGKTEMKGLGTQDQPFILPVSLSQAEASSLTAEYTLGFNSHYGTLNGIYENQNYADSNTSVEFTITSLGGKTTYYQVNPTFRDNNPGVEGKDIQVTFRLIGATQSTSGSYDIKQGIKDADYITWLKTGTYKISSGSSVSDLFTTALIQAGITYEGMEENYVSAIYAPSVLGNYSLSEFSNGSYSGWMYTVNGRHPNKGLNEYVLSNGDTVVWHYVNDYRYEVSDWSQAGGSQSLGDASTWDIWLKAADINPTVNTPTTGTSSATSDKKEENPSDEETNEVTSELKPVMSVIDSTAKTTISKEDVENVLKANATNLIIHAMLGESENDIDRSRVMIEKAALETVLKQKNMKITIDTNNGTIVADSAVLESIVKQAEGREVNFIVESVSMEDAKEQILDESIKTALNGNSFATSITVSSTAGRITSFNQGELKLILTPASEHLGIYNALKVGGVVSTYVTSETEGNVRVTEPMNGTIVNYNGSHAVLVESPHLSMFVVTDQIVRQNPELKTTKLTVKKTMEDTSFALDIKNTGDGSLTYKSSNQKVATVSSTGTVNLKGTGKAVITIKSAKTKYYNKATLSVVIKVAPGKTWFTQLKKSGSLLRAEWNKVKGANGYQIEMADDRNMKKNVKSVHIGSRKKTEKTIKQLTDGKKYYIRIRAYKTINGKKVYGEWSKTKACK